MLFDNNDKLRKTGLQISEHFFLIVALFSEIPKNKKQKTNKSQLVNFEKSKQEPVTIFTLCIILICRLFVDWLLCFTV